MKYWIILLVIVAFVTAPAFGGNRPPAAATGKALQACDLSFDKLDSGHKGYLSYEDFRKGWEGPVGHKAMGPYGDVRQGFAVSDKDRDGHLTAREYCRWKEGA